MPLNNKPTFKDKNTRNKIDLHLRDINDEITEQDIANVKTDVTPNSADLEAEAEATHIIEDHKAEDERKDKEDGNNSNSVESSWDILK